MSSARLAACQSLLEAKSLDALLVTSPPNVLYLSGFLRASSPRDYLRPIAVLLTRDHPPELIVPAVELPIAERCAWPGTTRGYSPDSSDAAIKISEPLGRVNARSLGVEKESLAILVAEGIRSQIDSLRFVDISQDLEPIWWVKRGDEVSYIERAARLCALGFQAARQAAEEHEAELVAKGRGDCAALDAAAQEFPENRVQVISGVVAGDRTSAAGGHEVPTGRVPRSGEPIFMYWAASCEGYWAMLSRTIVWQPPEHLLRIQERLEIAKQAALQILRPGVEGREIYGVAIEALNASDDPPIPSVVVGRGIGATTGERPFLDAECRIELQPGMVLWIGPEIYGKFGGFGTIDTVLITSDGHRSLTHGTADSPYGRFYAELRGGEQ